MGNGCWKLTKMGGFHDCHGKIQLIYEESSSFFGVPSCAKFLRTFTWLGLEGYSLIFHGEQVTSEAQDSQVGEHKQLNSWVYGQKYRIYGGYEMLWSIKQVTTGEPHLVWRFPIGRLHHVASPFRWCWHHGFLWITPAISSFYIQNRTNSMVSLVSFG